MEGFCSMEEDWGLEAIVRGCTHDRSLFINVINRKLSERLTRRWYKLPLTCYILDNSMR